MAATFNDAGFTPKSESQILTDLRAEVASATALGANVNTADESVPGQMLSIEAAALAELAQATEQAVQAYAVNTASGAQLTNLAATFGISRHPAESSQVVIDLAGTAATVIPATAAITDTNDTRWTIGSATTIGSLGSASATFYADTTGPVAALASTSWTIATPVSGWSGATNAADATLGRDEETDAALRARLLDVVKGAAASGIDGVRRAVLALSGVTECLVIENVFNWADADGRPAKSMEVIVRGGTDADIGKAVWAHKPTGIETTTTVSGGNQITESVSDATGASQTVYASRPDLVSVYVEVDYEPLTTFPTNGEALIQQAILDLGNSLTLQDQGVYPPNVEAAIHDAFTGRVFKQLVLRMGLSASPGSAVAVPTSYTQLADFDSSRITIARL